MIIGRSVEGRPIEACTFGAGPGAVLVHGGIHGDEPGSVELCRRFEGELAARPPARPVIIVAAVNPDGLAATVKANARGVDLNRNFPARSWRREHAPGYFPGAAPLSEPETQALASLVERARPARIVAVHQPLACVNFDGPARGLAERMAGASGWPLREELGYPTPGSFGGCYGIDGGLEVITLELPRPASEDDLAAGLRALRVASEETGYCPRS